MIELAEMYPRDENSSFITTCLKCRELDASLTSSDLTSTSDTVDGDENAAFNYEFADIKLEKIEHSTSSQQVKANEAR